MVTLNSASLIAHFKDVFGSQISDMSDQLHAVVEEERGLPHERVIALALAKSLNITDKPQESDEDSEIVIGKHGYPAVMDTDEFLSTLFQYGLESDKEAIDGFMNGINMLHSQMAIVAGLTRAMMGDRAKTTVDFGEVLGLHISAWITSAAESHGEMHDELHKLQGENSRLRSMLASRS